MPGILLPNNTFPTTTPEEQVFVLTLLEGAQYAATLQNEKKYVCFLRVDESRNSPDLPETHAYYYRCPSEGPRLPLNEPLNRAEITRLYALLYTITGALRFSPIRVPSSDPPSVYFMIDSYREILVSCAQKMIMMVLNHEDYRRRLNELIKTAEESYGSTPPDE